MNYTKRLKRLKNDIFWSRNVIFHRFQPFLKFHFPACTTLAISIKFYNILLTPVGQASEWRVWLRDYPTNLISASEVHWSGTLCGAEQRGREELNFRDVSIDPGLPWSAITVPRNLCPLRFFHDITMKYQLIEFGWGPSMEAAWGELQHALDRITSRPADNSPPLPWWDKQRMKMRGRIVSAMNESNWHHLASRFPYCHEERLCWEWKPIAPGKTGLLIDWTHGTILFKGDLIICINTKRKYSNIHFLELPGLKMEWKIDWNLDGSNKTGHNLFPSATTLPKGMDLINRPNVFHFYLRDRVLSRVVQAIK